MPDFIKYHFKPTNWTGKSNRPENNSGNRYKPPWQTRYYQALIDAKQLESGWDYQKLKNVYIIMILPYDPFDRNRMVYTVKNQCVEAPDIPYEDGAKKIYLNTKGTEGTPSQALKNMLKYIENSIAENVTDTNIQAIHNYVSEVKQDRKALIPDTRRALPKLIGCRPCQPAWIDVEL